MVDVLDYQMAVFNDSDSDNDEAKHPLYMLAKAAKLMNAKQMELSKDMECHVSLPGKHKKSKQVRKHACNSHFIWLSIFRKCYYMLS